MLRMVLTDEQWQTIEGLLPGKPGDRGRSAKDNRLFVEAVLWLARTGSRGATFRPSSATGIRRMCALRVGAMQASGNRVALALAGERDLARVFIDSPSFAPTSTPQAPKKSRTAGAGALAWRPDNQAALCRRCLGQTAAHDSERRTGRRHRVCARFDCRYAVRQLGCRQRIRCQRLGHEYRGIRRASSHPASLQPYRAQAVRPLRVPRAKSDRALLQPYQALPSDRHTLRQARMQLHGIRADRLCGDFISLYVKNNPRFSVNPAAQ